MKLPLVFFYFACSYLVCFGIWYSNIRLIQSGKPGHFSAEGERPVIFHIHQLMTVLIVLKFFSLFFESIRYYWLQKYGEALVWSFFYYSVTFVKGIFLFTVILLIGTGWSFVKPFLNAREMKIVLVIFVLQVANNVAIFVLSQETEGESSYKAWTGVLHIVDIICCCAVLIPIVWQVNEMEKNAGITDYEGDEIHPSKATQENGTSGASHDEDNDDNKDDALSKLKLFRTFYLIVMGYVYTTRIVIYLFASFLDYRHAWLQEFIIELTTLAFYVMVGILFRPVPASPAYQRVRIDLNDVTDDSTLNEVELQPTNAYKTH